MTPKELYIIHDIIPPEILQMLNAGNMEEAIALFDCEINTSTNIIKIEHTNSQNQVITGPRNVSSNPTKTDKYPTSFFTNSYQEHPKRIIELKEAEDRYQKDKLNKVRFRKSEEYKKQVHFRPNFKPSGPTEYID